MLYFPLMFSLYALHHHHALFPVKRSVHSQAPVPWTHYPLYCSYHWLCQTQRCLQWSYEGNVEVDGLLALRTGLLWMKKEQKGYQCGGLWVIFWAINLLNPTLAMPIIFWMLSTRYWVKSQLSIKLWWHLLFCWPLSLCCTTDCHYQHILSSSTRSVEPLLQTVFQVAAGLSVSVCVYVPTYEFMYWCVKAAGMLTRFRPDMSCVW